MNEFMRQDLTGPSKKATEALDWVDEYILHTGATFGRLHMHSHHWDYINNALKRNKTKEVSASTHAYRGLMLIRIPPR